MNHKHVKILLIAVIILILTPFIPITTADPTVMVTNYSLEPETLLPGDTAELTITLTNTETTSTYTDTDYINNLIVDQTVGTIAATINNVWITSDGDGTNDIQAQQNYEDIGDLSPGSSITLSFQLYAEKNISTDTYYPTVHVDVDDYQDVSYPIPIHVDTRTVTIISNTVPSKISIGGSTDLTFSIINKRKNTVDSLTISSAKNNTLAFNPTSMFLDSLEPGSSEEIQFSVHPTEIGMNTLALNISYMNGDNLHYEHYPIPLEIIEVLDVAPIFTNLPRSISKGGSSRIGLEVYNAKTDSITGVIITPVIDTTVIPSQYFIGAMDPDDVFSASFDLYTDMLDYGNHTIQFKVTFKQGNEYYETPYITHTFRVVKGEGVSYQTSSNGQSTSENVFDEDLLNTCLITIAVIGVIAAVVIIWRWKKGRNNQ